MNRVRALSAALGLLVLLAVAGLPSPATAWELNKATNGVVLSRSPDDTATVVASVNIYYDYKGGTSWNLSTYPIYSVSSWNKVQAVGTLQTGTNEVSAIEIPLVSYYRMQDVRVSWTVGGTTYYEHFGIVNDPVRVDVSNEPTVAIAALPPVSLATSVSVVGTLPVESAALPGLSPGDSGLLYGVFGLACVLLVYVLLAWLLSGRAHG